LRIVTRSRARGSSVTPSPGPRKAGARPGDLLLLTKPLGTGIILTAARGDACAPDHLQAALDSMLRLNRHPSHLAREAGVHACTDVTGFGLLGHLREVAAASGVGATISLEAVPVLPEAWRLVRAGVCPGGTHRNLKSLEGSVEWAPEMGEDVRLVLSDAQTSGGLLISVPAARVDALTLELRRNGTPYAAVLSSICASIASSSSLSRMSSLSIASSSPCTF
jgi:selenide,water dikinase